MTVHRGVLAVCFVLAASALAACAGTRTGDRDHVVSVALACDRNDGGAVVRVDGEQCDTLANPFGNVASDSSQGVLLHSYLNIRFVVTVRRPDTSTYEVTVPAAVRQSLSSPLTPPATAGDTWPPAAKSATPEGDWPASLVIASLVGHFAIPALALWLLAWRKGRSRWIAVFGFASWLGLLVGATLILKRRASEIVTLP